ncbi:MAG: glutamine--fructose-6-phosphate transaminase (isomerizing) [Puniceicoccales bacterium]|jgi:glucosamine--fructose-6-phosphate aminotransferase (isomerizing)|nr:glutamine--fructose-6-phosphate transaminase (isomerizing) [Puniceicoccales bacterium]
MGYLGRRQAKGILLEGLRHLEYRGYDSTGIATWEGTDFSVVRAVGHLDALIEKIGDLEICGTAGIGHTRWATHGAITEGNAHPHRSCDGKVVIVHNGVVENFLQIGTFLGAQNYRSSSETDSEVLANLIAYHCAKEDGAGGHSAFLEGVRRALLHVRGAYGIVAMHVDFPGEMVGARNSSPLILGIGDGEFFFSSDTAGFASHAKDAIFLNDGEMAHLVGGDFSICTLSRERVEAARRAVEWREALVEKNGYAHFMLKEIYEQPTTLRNAMRGRFSPDGSGTHFGGLQMSTRELLQIDRIVFCACGSARFACAIGEYLIERIARIPVEVEYASEFRYRNAPLDKNTLVVAVSQSGETIDTLSALLEAKRKGFRVMAITNGVGSSIAREADGGIYQHAGPEIGVAATKTFTSQVCLMAMLAIHLGRLRDLSCEDGTEMVDALQRLPSLVEEALELDDAVRSVAEKYAHCDHMFFLGRQSMFPVAMEGALKLKEVAYVHADGYAAAEMKHGPIALIGKDCPAFFLACDGRMLEKIQSNVQEVRARGARIVVAVCGDDRGVSSVADDVLILPRSHDITQALISTIAVQLFAYHMGVLRGCNVDCPRNLAKSVTVE